MTNPTLLVRWRDEVGEVREICVYSPTSEEQTMAAAEHVRQRLRDAGGYSAWIEPMIEQGAA
jgi:hypothetical protein